MTIDPNISDKDLHAIIKSIFEDLLGGPMVCVTQIIRLTDPTLLDIVRFPNDENKQFVLETMIEATKKEPWDDEDPNGPLKSRISLGIIVVLHEVANGTQN